MIVYRNKKLKCSLPSPVAGIERVNSLKVLGVTLIENLHMDTHISNICSKANSDLFALKTLRSHGLEPKALSQVCRATLISKLTYASPAWRGFCTASDISRLESVERKARRWGLYSDQSSSITDLLDQADKDLFNKTLTNSNHVMHSLLPPIRSTGHNLRQRGHIYTLPAKTNFTSRNFLIRMLYSCI